MSQEDLFPDYEPKKTPDTIFDYGVPVGSKLEKVLQDLGAKPTDILPIIELEKLGLAIQYFKEYTPKAEANPGTFQEGHPLIDGPKGKYVPSEEELIISEIGKMIQNLLSRETYKRIQGYKEFFKIEDQELVYQEIHFSHADFMGSGRFFFAEKMKERIRISF